MTSCAPVSSGRGDLEQPLQVIHKHLELPFAEHDWRGREARRGSRRAGRERTPAGFRAGAGALAAAGPGAYGRRALPPGLHPPPHPAGWLEHAQLLGEVLARYRRTGRAHGWAYRDYIAWLQAQDKRVSEAFWKEQLAELLEPTRLAQAVAAEREQVGSGQFQRSLPPARTARLKTFAQRHAVTLNTLVQAAWSLLLQRYTGRIRWSPPSPAVPPNWPGSKGRSACSSIPCRWSPRRNRACASPTGCRRCRRAACCASRSTPLFEIQRWAGLGEALFDSLLVFENYPVAEALEKGSPGGVRFGPVSNHEQTNYPLTVARASATV